MAGSGDELSRKTAIPRRTLESYLSGTSEPKATRLLEIARAVNVDAGWLVTGEGEPAAQRGLNENAQGGGAAFGFPASFRKTGPDVVSKVAVRQSIRAVRLYMDKHGGDMTPEEMADAILSIAELAPKYGEIDEDLVARLMKFRGA